MPFDFLPAFPAALNTLAVFGLLLAFGAIGGYIAHRFEWLPSITGFMLVGFALGPSGLGVISAATLADARVLQQIGALAGGGLFELGCHMIDAVLTLLGKPAEVKAFSTPTQADGMKDNQLAVLVYPKATVTLRCNHADPFGGPRRRFQVTGTKGNIEIMPMESGELVARFSEPHGTYKKGEQRLKLSVPKGRYDGEFIDLAKVIRGEKKLAWDAAHDIAVHETVLLASGQNA
jgi:hypothetical protein